MGSTRLITNDVRDLEILKRQLEKTDPEQAQVAEAVLFGDGEWTVDEVYLFLDADTNGIVDGSDANAFPGLFSPRIQRMLNASERAFDLEEYKQGKRSPYLSLSSYDVVTNTKAIALNPELYTQLPEHRKLIPEYVMMAVLQDPSLAAEIPEEFISNSADQNQFRELDIEFITHHILETDSSEEIAGTTSESSTLDHNQNRLEILAYLMRVRPETKNHLSSSLQDAVARMESLKTRLSLETTASSHSQDSMAELYEIADSINQLEISSDVRIYDKKESTTVMAAIATPHAFAQGIGGKRSVLSDSDMHSMGLDSLAWTSEETREVLEGLKEDFAKVIGTFLPEGRYKLNVILKSRSSTETVKKKSRYSSYLTSYETTELRTTNGFSLSLNQVGDHGELSSIPTKVEEMIQILMEKTFFETAPIQDLMAKLVRTLEAFPDKTDNIQYNIDFPTMILR